MDKDLKGNYYLVVHSGSRHLGMEVAKYYQKLAKKTLINDGKEELITSLKEQHREKEIQKALEEIKPLKIQSGLEYLEGKNMKDYLHDCDILKDFAHLSRLTMLTDIITGYFKETFNTSNFWETVHNYINTKDMILRKGSISAKSGEKVIIPINMRDGSIIGIGKGNADYNYSAPHGAGRLFSRSFAKEIIGINDFIESMEGIYTTSVNESTIDESCFAYKSLDQILPFIEDTISVSEIIKPVYNFKASE